MKITIEIECDNDAFQPNPKLQVERILSDVALRLPHRRAEFAQVDRPLLDANGNRVGSVRVEP